MFLDGRTHLVYCLPRCAAKSTPSATESIIVMASLTMA